MRRLLAKPIGLVGDVVYEATLFLDMLHGAISGEAFE